MRPTKPRELVGEAAREWNRLVPELIQAGYLTRLDRGVMIRYCRAWDRWNAIDKKLEEDLVVGSEGTLVRNPLWFVRADLERTLAGLGDRLGLAPAPRRRMNVKHINPEAKVNEEPPAELDAYRERLAAARAATENGSE